MNYSIYYLSIKSTSLAHYFSKAIITPAMYYSNRPEDIQSLFQETILLSNKKWVEESDCCIELVIAEHELQYIEKLSDEFFYYKKPIPISRVKCIYFIDEMQKKLTIANINNGAAFVPESIVSTIEKKKADTAQLTENTKITDKYDKEAIDNIKTYNQILGGMAFMRFGKKNSFYSSNYFSTLSFFNQLIKDELEKNSLKFTSSYFGAFENNDQWKSIHALIYEDIQEEDVKRIAQEEKIEYEKSNGIIQLDKIEKDSNTYKIAVLQTYGQDKRKKIDDLISDIFSGKIHECKVECITLIVGINHGYANFYNKYNIAGIEKNVKFRLDSKLDYYTIESIYQFVFNKKKDSREFKYIDRWCTVAKRQYDNQYESILILDKTIITDKKKVQIGSQEYSQNLASRDLRLSEIIKQVRDDCYQECSLKNETEKYNIELEYKQEVDKLKLNFGVEQEKVDAIVELEKILRDDIAKKDDEIYSLKEENIKLKEKVTEIGVTNSKQKPLKKSNKTKGASDSSSCLPSLE